MKRQLSFDFENEQYILKENGQIIFSIDAQELNLSLWTFITAFIRENPQQLN